jgi:hypothetical protein
MPLTPSERSALSAVRASMERLRGPQAPAASRLGRVEYMRRHFDEIDRDIRHGMLPAPTHLTALAAHCVILYLDEGDDASA